MTIEQIAAQLRSLGSLPARAAALAAPRLEAALKKQVVAGKAPNGEPWPPKKDGGRPLEHAADHVHVEASGDVVTVVVDGPEYWHQKAKPGGSLPRRQLIPDVGDALPSELERELRGATDQAFRELTGGR